MLSRSERAQLGNLYEIEKEKKRGPQQISSHTHSHSEAELPLGSVTFYITLCFATDVRDTHSLTDIHVIRLRSHFLSDI